MPYHRPKTGPIDVLMVLLGFAIAAPFVMMLVAPFTHGL